VKVSVKVSEVPVPQLLGFGVKIILTFPAAMSDGEGE
jgi:hypothetical protein